MSTPVLPYCDKKQGGCDYRERGMGDPRDNEMMGQASKFNCPRCHRSWVFDSVLNIWRQVGFPQKVTEPAVGTKV